VAAADVWNAATGSRLFRLGGQNGSTISVTFAPGGTQLMTTSSDGNFRLIDLASRKLVGGPLPGLGGSGWGTYFPDGTRVIAAYDTGIGVIWKIGPAAWKEHACAVAGRNLTRAEWHDFLPERSYRPVCP
jgi:WD40 repeat protein